MDICLVDGPLIYLAFLPQKAIVNDNLSISIARRALWPVERDRLMITMLSSSCVQF